MIQLARPGTPVGQVFCENFRTCPEEERTGVANGDWMRYLGADLSAPAPKRVDPEPVLTSGLIYLKAVQERVAERRSEEASEPFRPPSFPIPAVLVPRREEQPVSTRAWLIGALAVLGAVGVVGYQVLRGGPGASAGVGAPEPRPSARAALPAGNSPDEARRGTLVVPTDGPSSGLAASSAPTAPDPRPDAVADRSPEATAPRARHQAEKRSRSRHHHRAVKDRSRLGSRDADRDVDVNSEAKLANYSLEDALAKAAAGTRPPVPAAPVERKNDAPGRVSAGGAPLTLPAGSSGSRDPQVANGVDALLRKASAPSGAASAPPTTLEPVLPSKLGTAQVERISRQLVRKVRGCAERFGFAKLTIRARAEMIGATGALGRLSLAGRFAGSPVEQCARRSSRGLSSPRFQAPSQTLSVPVVIP